MRGSWSVPLLALALACTNGDSAKDSKDVTDGTTDGSTPIPVPQDCDDDSLIGIRPVEDFPAEEVLDWPLLHWIPENPRAIVYMFHGHGGDIGDMRKIHPTRIQNLFVEAGIGIVVTESQDRLDKSWNKSNSPTNDDMVHLSNLRDHFMATTDWDEDTPIVGWGFSGGGSFVDTFATVALVEYGWPVVGTIFHNTLGVGVDGLPALFLGSENDDQDPEPSYVSHVDAGNQGEFFQNVERPWTPQDMLLHPSYTENMAQAVFDELVEFQYIDEQGVRIPPLDRLENLMESYHDDSTLDGPLRVTPLLRVAWATHRVSSEFGCHERDFVVDLVE